MWCPMLTELVNNIEPESPKTNAEFFDAKTPKLRTPGPPCVVHARQ